MAAAFYAVAFGASDIGAIQITKHDHYRDPQTKLKKVATWTVDVAPRDSDDDGFANREDDCPRDGYTGNRGCTPEPPAPQPTSTTESVSSGYAIPTECVMGESGGDWTAVNPTSGAGGAYQIIPSTWAAYGGTGSPQNASPEEQSAIAAQIWADSGAAAWVAC